MDARTKLDMLIKRNGETYSSLSRLLGRNSAYIQQFIKRGSPERLDDFDATQLALHFGIDPEDLGVAPTVDGGRVAAVRLPVNGPQGRNVSGEAPRLVDKKWLAKLTSEPAGVEIVLVEGAAMQPSLQEGDEVLVQRLKPKEGLRDGLYALKGSKKVLIRRIALEPTGNRISVLTDHPSYPNWQGINRRSVEVLGRVIWIGLRLS